MKTGQVTLAFKAEELQEMKRQAKAAGISLANLIRKKFKFKAAKPGRPKVS